MGQKLQGITLLITQLGTTLTEVDKMLFQFDSHSLLLEIDYDFDKIVTRIVQGYTLEKREEEHEIVSVSELNFSEYEEILNTKLIWLWEMTNNQGHVDGIQMEFENQITFQFLVEASYFRNSRLTKINHKATIPKTGNRDSKNYGRNCKYT